MKRIVLASLILAASLLAGCVVTPAYRYSGGSAGYYYGDQPYNGATVIYGDTGNWYPYGGYYNPWVVDGGGYYYYDHDGHRYRGYDRDGHHDRNDYRGGHSNRLADKIRRQDGPRRTYSGSTPTYRSRPQSRNQRSGASRSQGRRESRGYWHKEHK